ncbi:branched-chain amino acid ABC transporter permease [Pigmentiphaga sp.]|jgi:ABC-type branched-chain amino acid transport system, permease component|uniref:branched-chain amino acid ABC transporter permease n=1 Tax=Pigmentiphaga sp. TaxID=1977564 RepID=UPI0025DCDEBB|nr:branched-chain amino acid ABC transporter permease [Pigmentiphaga sp.]MBX6317350.1 branched-chain amino acid ABC transporter permease [Pigmentiphaga sp.]
MNRVKLGAWLIPVLFLLLACVPFVAQAIGEPFYITFFARVLVYALAACALNLVLGFAGLVSFGHAMFIGLGCYAVGILTYYGFSDGWLQLGVAVAVCALVALVVGSVCLRTSGIGFIMITLAFAQMFYFLMVSMTTFGGDDGLNINEPSNFGLFELSGSSEVYWAAWVVLLAATVFMARLKKSPFGMVLRATHINPRRVNAFGYSVFRVQLAAYVISGVLTGVAGVLLANLTAFASPSYMSWPVSGDLIVMLVIGGLGTIVGPIIGAVAFLVMEEFFKGLTQHWMLIMGPVIVVIALLTRNGFGWLTRQREAQSAQTRAPVAGEVPAKAAAVPAGEAQ